MSGGLGGGDSPSHGTWSQCCHPPASETLCFGHQGRKPLALSLFFLPSCCHPSCLSLV